MIRTFAIHLFNTPEVKTYYVHRNHSYNNDTKVAFSQLLVCPECRETWAMLHFIDEKLIWPVAQVCENCTYRDDWLPVPGSLLVEEGWGVIDDALLAALPEELLKREFDLHAKVYANG